MRLGLVGLGRIGAFHAETLRNLPQVSALIVHDVKAAAVAAQTENEGVEAAPDLAELFGAGIDGLVIAAATDVHAELILAALDAGVPCFCEKPLARDPQDAIRVLRRSEQSDVPVQVGYPRRFDVAFQAAREAVASGELGWVHTVRSTTLDPHHRRRPTFDPPAGSSGTAACTTSTPSATSPVKTSSRSTPPDRTKAPRSLARSATSTRRPPS